MTRRRIVGVAVVGVTVIVGSCWWVAGVLSQDSREDIGQTVIRGLKDRQSRVSRLQGMAVASQSYEADTLEVLAKGGGQSWGDRVYSSRGLHRIAFWLDFGSNRWRIDVGELRSSGLNEWGFLRNYGEREGRPEVPALIEVCDGSDICLWDVAAGRATTKQYDPGRPSGGGQVKLRLVEFLLLDVRRLEIEQYHLEGEDMVEGLKCYRLGRDVDRTHSHITLWVAPERGFALVRYMGLSMLEEDPASGSRTVIAVSGLVDVGNNMWVPTESRMTVYGYARGRARALAESCTVRFENVIVGQDAPDWLFHLQLPVGTIVESRGRGSHSVGRAHSALAEDEENPAVPKYAPEYMHAPGRP